MSVLNSPPTLEDLLDGAAPTGLLTILKDEYAYDYKEQIERIHVKEGETLINEDDPPDFIFIVIKGNLQASVTGDDGREVIFGQINPGEPAGEVQNFTSGWRDARVVALTDTSMIKIPNEIFEKLAFKSSRIVKRMAAISRRRLRKNQVILILTNFLGPLNEVDLNFIQLNTRWVNLKRGDSLFKQGDPGDSLCVLISGRLLAAVEDEEGNERIVGEVTQGELVGEMSILTGAPRSASVYALRDSLLALFSNETIQQIISKYPQVMMYTARTIIQRLSKTIKKPSQSRLMTSIAIVPANQGVPLKEFTLQFEEALTKYTPTLHLNSEKLDSIIGIQGVSQTDESNPYNNRLSTTLEAQATKPHLIIYECDPTATPWTRRCIRQADQVLILANSSDSPDKGKIEKELLDFNTGITAAGQTLILLHEQSENLPTGTNKWLTNRKVDAHYHVRWGRDKDFQRLARIFTGNAVGLVLGGGGARGLAHIGIIKVLREEGIPIDMVGGCSIGSIIAAQPAMDWEDNHILEVNKHFFVKGKPANDYTLPALSIVRGRKLENYLSQGFGDTQIEDLWKTFFCVSSNLSKSEIVEHRQGTLWKAVRSSISIPGVFAPVLENNDLLIDGGLLNNLPADIMHRMCKGKVIAVDVTPKKDFNMPGSTIPSPWDVVRNRLLPSNSDETIPSIFDILTRSTLLGSACKTDELKSHVDLYLNPPIDKYGLLEFTALEEIAEIGYNYAKDIVKNWKSEVM